METFEEIKDEIENLVDEEKFFLIESQIKQNWNRNNRLALSLSMILLAVSEKLSKTSFILKSFICIGISHYKMSNFDEALTNYLNAYNLIT